MKRVNDENDFHAELHASTHEVSERSAVIACERDSIWLYLTTADPDAFDGDCWLFNLSSAPEAPVIASYKDEAPPVPHKLTAGAAIHDPSARDRWSLLWSRDGRSVLALLSGRPIGMILADQRRGYSARLAKACAWGSPLDASLLQKHFPPIA